MTSALVDTGSGDGQLVRAHTDGDRPDEHPRDSRGVARFETVLARTGTRALATLAWLPIGLAVFTVVGFLTGPESQETSQRLGAVLFGVAEGTLTWLTAAVAANELVLARRANLRSYFDLKARFAALRADLDRVGETRPASAALRGRLGKLRTRLSSQDDRSGWSSGEAFVAIWRDLHRIEEEFIEFEEKDRLSATLAHDELRVAGSKLNRADNPVRKKIDKALRMLADGPEGALRQLLQEIRHAVNEFRDGGFEALVRARTAMERVSALLGFTTWALLCLAILMSASRMDVAVVSGIYLVGVAAGLFTRLRNGGPEETREDVYGYGQASDRQIILLSGLAAIAGVFLAGAGAAGSGVNTTIGSSWTMTATPALFLTAAIAGLAPGVLVDRLNVWAKANLTDLDNTTPGKDQPTSAAA